MGGKKEEQKQKRESKCEHVRNKVINIWILKTRLSQSEGNSKSEMVEAEM